MTLAVNALQKAIYVRLSGQLAPVNVFKYVPQRSSFPYVIIGEKTSIPFRAKDDDGQECTVTIHIWSNQSGDKQCAELAEAVYAALDRQEDAIPVTGYALTEITVDFTQILADTGDEAEPDRFFHGIVRARAIVAGGSSPDPGDDDALQSEDGDTLVLE